MINNLEICNPHKKIRSKRIKELNIFLKRKEIIMSFTPTMLFKLH
jgi:hypothetical protein